MKLLTIDARPGGRTGALLGEDVLDFAAAAGVIPAAGWVPGEMHRLLAGGAEGLELIRRIVGAAEDANGDERDRLLASGALRPRSEVRLLAPVPRPGILLSHGRSYHNHLREMQKTDTPKIQGEPSAFMKNANSIVGPDDLIRIPPQFPDMVDFEGEFSIIFGAEFHNVSPAEATRYVAGYTIVNDVSSRDWIEHFHTTNDPDLNRMGKQLPSYSPMGPVIVTADEIPDPHDVTLTTTLNGEIMQSAHTSDLVWRVSELISYFSRWYPFRAGDVLTTGSPAGVGFGRDPKVFMKSGDVIAIRVDRIGTLSNRVL